MKKAFCLFNTVSFATGGAGYGLFTIPLSTVFAWGRGRYRRKYSHPRFVLGSDSTNKKELSVDAWGLLKIKRNGAKATFDDLLIRWGSRPLGIGDALVNSSGCESGSYYLARHIWGNEYRLDNGKKVILTSPVQEYCNGNGGGGEGQNKKVDTIKLNFQKSGNGAATNLMIWIKSCDFTWEMSSHLGVQKRNLKVSCKGNSNTNGSAEETVTLTLDTNIYKE